MPGTVSLEHGQPMRRTADRRTRLARHRGRRRHQQSWSRGLPPRATAR
jgi:hypothetical protein